MPVPFSSPLFVKLVPTSNAAALPMLTVPWLVKLVPAVSLAWQ